MNCSGYLANGLLAADPLKMPSGISQGQLTGSSDRLGHGPQTARASLKNVALKVDRLVDEAIGLGVLLPRNVLDSKPPKAPGELPSPLEKLPQHRILHAVPHAGGNANSQNPGGGSCWI